LQFTVEAKADNEVPVIRLPGRAGPGGVRIGKPGGICSLLASGKDGAGYPAGGPQVLPARWTQWDMKDLQPKRCSRLLRALADPERLRIIQRLRQGPKSVGELAGLLSSHLVKVSHHLGVLRQAGLVDDARRGRFVIYQLHPDVYQPGGEGEASDYINLGCCRLELPR
jgi:DNA-binding transcriptional ArsR family regulator